MMDRVRVISKGEIYVKIAVLGAGAIGCFYGGVLAKQGLDVAFAARGKTRDYLQQHDLIVHSINGDFSLPVKVLDADHLQPVDDLDFILLAVKSNALDQCIPELKTLTGPCTKIICLLNGIGNEEKLVNVFGAEHVAGGSAFISVIREAPGVVDHVGEGKLIIGEWKTGEAAQSLEWLGKMFRQAGVDTHVSPDIRQVKWDKLLWNIIYNPLTALTRTRVGEALNDTDLFPILAEVKKEYIRTASAVGITINRDYAEKVLLPNRDVQNHKTSMLQDLEHGRKMELEAILGFVIKTARAKQVPVTAIETIYHLLRFLDLRNAK